MCNFEGVRRIYFGIPVTESVLSSLVGTTALLVGAMGTTHSALASRAAIEI